MEGPKRIEITTVGPPGKDKKKKPPAVTVRFNLDLVDSNDTTCPEFFYSDLIKTVPGSELKSTSDDPFGDDDADAERLAAIAKSFEDKYNKPEAKKKKKKKWRDNMEYAMMDLGDGYDDDDTFIDNSEAYDEVLPGRLTTKLGGFYINSGKLDLREVSDDSEDEFTPGSVKKNKKRRISSDDDSEGEDRKIVKKKKIKDGVSVEGEVKKKIKKIVAPGEKGFKKPKLPHDKDKPKPNKTSNVSALLKSTSPNLNGDSVENGDLSSDSSDDSNPDQPSVKSSISMTIESVISMATKDDSNSKDNYDEQKKDIDPENIPKLPSALPLGMDQKLEGLKMHAKISRDGKCKFFTPNVNKLLLEVEMLSKQMTVGNRSGMYAHLSAFLPCSKDTLLKRAKSLRVKELEDKIKEPMDKLREAVNRIMPGLLEKFEADQQKAALEKSEEVTKDGEKEGKEENTTESDEEDKTNQSNQSETTKKRQTGPRKKFAWDSNVRTLLCDVVRVKMHTYQMAKTRSQTAEEYCKSFLDADVRPIWPKGWMQTRALYKESKQAHTLWTNPQKPKKGMLVMSKTPGVTIANPMAMKPTNPASAPTGLNVSKISAVGSKSETTNNVAKSVTPGNANMNGSKSLTSTPNVPPKKPNPTLLDYSTSSALNLSGTSFASPISVSSLINNNNLMKSLLSPSQLKGDDIKNLQQSKNSWDHIVSDILRSSITEPSGGKSTPQQTPPQMQRQNSTPSPSVAENNSFLAQFEKYAMFPKGQGPQTSPNTIPSAATGSHMTVSQQQQKLLQQQIEKRDQQHKREQLKLIQEQALLLQEKQKLLQKQDVAARMAASIAKSVNQSSAQRSQVVKNQSSPKMQASNNNSVQKVQMSANQSGQMNQVTSNHSNQPPNQSPMSMAMGRSGSAAIVQKGTPKQLLNQFGSNSQSGMSMSMMTENMIRQQLNAKDTTPKPIPQGKVVHKTAPHMRTLSNPGQDLYSQVSSSTDLRKPSPSAPAKGSQSAHSHMTGAAHVIKVSSQPPQNSQSKTYNTSSTPSTVTLTTNGKPAPATNLLKSFIGQAQQITSTNLSNPQQQQQQQRSGVNLTTTSPGALGTPTNQWSPSTMKSSLPGRPTYPGSGDSQPKPYRMPSTSPHPVPGYQSVRLQNLSADQIAVLQQAAKQRRLSDGGMFNNPLAQRPAPDSTK